MSYHSADALADDNEERPDAPREAMSAEVIEDAGIVEVAPESEVADSAEEADTPDEPVQMDITQAPEPEPGDVALPTMADLDEMVKQLDEIDAMLASLDSGELDEVAAEAQLAGSST